MRRTRTLIIVFCFALPAFLLATVPLSFALQLIGAPLSDVRWQKASGTIWKGTLSDISFRGQHRIGDVQLTARPFALFGGGVGYRLVWKDVMGEGSGDIVFGRQSLRISNLNLKVNFSGLADLLPDIRRTNGVVAITNANASFKDNICIRANGNIATDALSKLALQYNVSATDLQGGIACLEEALHIRAQGQVAQNGIVVSDVHLLLDGRSSLQVHVATTDPILGGGLLRYGFKEDTTGYIFRREINLATGLRPARL
jgi:hypothetical protein